ncbi:hypothetical protein HMI55_007038 [Coelomomyces lativittatus]|nr:hypothetical protein HMI55_007038 [Coelomomyces lativittatus]
MKEPPPKLPSLIIPVTDPQTLTSTTLVPSLVPSSLSTLAPTSPFFPTHASSSSSSSTSTTSTTTIPLSSVGSSKPTTYVSGYDPVDSETGLKAFPNLNDFILNESRDPGAGIPVLSTVVSPPTLSNHELRSMYLQSIHILKLKGELGPKERWQHAIFSILR